MKNWISTLYSQKSLVRYKNMRALLFVPLFLLVNLAASTPYFISFFTMSISSFFQTYPELKTSLTGMFDQLDCTLDQTLTCSTSNQIITFGNYTVYVLPAATPGVSASEIVLAGDSILITDKDAKIILSGTYVNIGKMTFREISNGIKTNSDTLDIVMKDIVLSSLSQNMIQQYLLLLIQNLIYLLVFSTALYLGFGLGRNKKIRIKESVAINVQQMFGPALLSGFIGIYYPGLAVIIFPILITLRFLLVYREIMHKKVNDSVYNVKEL